MLLSPISSRMCRTSDILQLAYVRLLVKQFVIKIVYWLFPIFIFLLLSLSLLLNTSGICDFWKAADASMVMVSRHRFYSVHYTLHCAWGLIAEAFRSWYGCTLSPDEWPSQSNSGLICQIGTGWGWRSSGEAWSGGFLTPSWYPLIPHGQLVGARTTWDTLDEQRETRDARQQRAGCQWQAAGSSS